jgi:PGF-pre-PGF domain-containing protein
VGIYPLPSNPSSSSNSGGGGGGGGGTSGEDFKNIIVKEKYDLHIYKDIVTSYKFTHINNPILSINIVGNVNAGEISTAVEVLRNTSSLVTTPAPGNVYKNVNVWVGTSGFGTSKNIKQAVITFRVENSWISSNNMKSSGIKMVRWDGSKWDQLETLEKTKDSTYIYFEAKSNSFSSFAITGIEKKETLTENAVIIEPEEKTSDFLINWFLIIGVFFAIGLIIEIYLSLKKK